MQDSVIYMRHEFQITPHENSETPNILQVVASTGTIW